MWSDFARFYAQRVLPLVNKIKYKPEFRKQVANLFNIKENQIGPLFKGYLAQVAERGLGNYFWDSISPDDFLTGEDKKTLK
ncbi:MAG TPA: hypothetical protein VEK32_20355 [Thermodesulfobacteriota bacterium]|nr:hypothetical protein [Thermodesulfobacteriota bacterium]